MKVRKHKWSESIFMSAIGLGMACLFSSCSYSLQEGDPSIKIVGSSTVYPITQQAVVKFRNNHNKAVEIAVNISGTGGGFRKFCQGQTDISNASRPIQEKEMTMCNRYGLSYIELPIAFDALTGEAGTVFGGKSQFDVTIPEPQRKQAQLRIKSN